MPLLVVSLLSGLSLTAGAANSVSIFSTSATSSSGEFDLSNGSNYSPSITPTAATTRDVEFAGSYGTTTFTINGGALAFGTLDDVDTTQSLIVSNNNATAGSITLSTASNSVSGTAADLLFVKSGANLTIQSETGTLTLNVGTNGNINSAGTLAITAPIVISNAFTYTLSFTGAGATTVSGGISGTSGKLTVNDAGGSVTLGGTNTYGNTTTVNAGTLNLTGTTAGGGVIINSGGTLVESSTGGINAAGGTNNVNVNGGSATLGGPSGSSGNNYHGITTVDGGGTFTVTGGVNSTGTLVLGNSALGGGTINYSNPSSSNVIQQFASTTFNAGASFVNSTINTDSLRLTGITRAVGSTVDFNTVGGITTTTTNASYAGGQATILGGYATVGGETTWATIASGAVNGLLGSAYSGTFVAAKDVNAPTGATTPSAGLTINSLRFNTAGSYSVNLGGALTVATGGILETSSVGANAAAINNSTLSSGNGTELFVIQNNTSGVLTIASQITGTGIGLTKSGAGILTVTAANSYTGATTVNAGSLLVGPNGSINSTSGLTVFGGATFGAAAGTAPVAIGTTSMPLNLNLGTTSAAQSNLQLNLYASGASDTVTAGALTLTGDAFTVTGATTGTVLITLNDTTSGNLSGTYNLLSWTSSSPGSIPLSDFALAGNVVGEGSLFVSGNNLEFIASVPEPSAWSLLPLAAGLVASRSRMKRFVSDLWNRKAA